jgi:hypothetical protein
MMDLRGIANQASSTVNPNILVSLETSNGYTMGAGQRQVPAYNPAIVGQAQVQALDSSDLNKLDGLNIQGDIRALYMFGNLAGVIRPDNKGGDLITIGTGAVPPLQGQWLVVKVLESWPSWTKVAMYKQSQAGA